MVTFRTSQFLRRLTALALLGGVVILAMGAQLVRLTVVDFDTNRTVAEARLDRTRFLPTPRGRILDRNGRVLAADRPSFDVALEWNFIAGAWSGRRAVIAARTEADAEGGAGTWRAMGAADRDRRILRHLPAAEADADAILNAVARAGGLDRAELESRLDEIRARVHRRAVAVWDRQLELERARFEDADERFTPRPIQEHGEAHVVLQAVPEAVAFELTRLADDWPGTLDVQESTARELPLATLEIDIDRSHLPRWLRSKRPIRVTVDGVADHLVGALREKVFPSDVAARPFLDPSTGAVVDLGGYRPGLDRVGAWGVEASQEARLRGTRGMVRTRLDTGEEQRIEPQPGADVTLTIDLELQAVIQALLDPAVGLMKSQPWHAPTNDDGEDHGPPKRSALHGAVVVLDVDSGEILAAVSTPTMTAGMAMSEAEREESAAFVNRPFEAPYPPGSILKPFIFLGAVAGGAMPVSAHVQCDGHYVPTEPDRLRCWIYRERTGFATHSAILGGPLNAQQAVARSCNIFFYTAAHRLGGSGLVDWLGGLGAGHLFDTGLLRERLSDDGTGTVVGGHAGFLPGRDERLATSAIIQMGIGQGPLAWTPLHAANALAILARGGVVRDPVLVRGAFESPLDRDRRRADVSMDPRAASLVLAGMREVVREAHGTGHHITYEDGTREKIVDDEGLVVWAKTGTVQTGEPPDHAWFAGLVGPASEQRPRYAIAVMVEHGRSGGRGAGPVFNAVLHGMRRLGYLPPLSKDASGAADGNGAS